MGDGLALWISIGCPGTQRLFNIVGKSSWECWASNRGVRLWLLMSPCWSQGRNGVNFLMDCLLGLDNLSIGRAYWPLSSVLSTIMQLGFYIWEGAWVTTLHFIPVLYVFRVVRGEKLIRVLSIAHDNVRLVSYFVHLFLLFLIIVLPVILHNVPFTVRIKLLLSNFSVSQSLSRLHIVVYQSLLRHQGVVSLLKSNSLLLDWTLIETYPAHDCHPVLAQSFFG